MTDSVVVDGMNWDFLFDSAIAVFVFMNLMFVLALRLKDNSIVDIGWGIGFILISSIGVIRHGQGTLHLLMFALVAMWGARLATYIFLRNRGKEKDFRYAAWRKEWGRSVVWRSYLQVFMLQGMFMLTIASPLWAAFSSGEGAMGWIGLVGVALWCIGFFFEAVGDAQMMAFKADPVNRGRIMRHGLWRYTRHPNYFGEAVLWWGIGLMAASGPVWYLALIGPAVLTFLLLRVSGVTMLEKKYEGNARYADYVRQTSAFVPWSPRS
jgi:steroid 5-alpha reductase family enzyme